MAGRHPGLSAACSPWIRRITPAGEPGTKPRMTTMTRSHLTLVVPALMTALAADANAAAPNLPEGRIYVLHSAATGACPSLDWHIVVERNDVLAGMVAWDNMRTMARATGRVDRKNGTF